MTTEKKEQQKQKIVDWKADPLMPKMAYVGEDEVFDAVAQAECPEGTEVALHVIQGSADGPASSLYMTPAQAYVLAERIRTAAWIAEKLGATDA